MSANGSDKGSKKGASSRSSAGTKKSTPEEHFGSEVDLKIRTATGNPKVEQYFGSEVDIRLRTADDPFNLDLKPKSFDPPDPDSKVTETRAKWKRRAAEEPEGREQRSKRTDLAGLENVDPVVETRSKWGRRANQDKKGADDAKVTDVMKVTDEASYGPLDPRPKRVDLAALDAKPFKDATNPASIRKLEERLEEVKEAENPTALPPGEEDPDDVGRKVSALFLAQVEVAEEDKDKKEREGQKKSFLEKMRAKKEAKKEKEEGKEVKLFEKQTAAAAMIDVVGKAKTASAKKREKASGTAAAAAALPPPGDKDAPLAPGVPASQAATNAPGGEATTGAAGGDSTVPNAPGVPGVPGAPGEPGAPGAPGEGGTGGDGGEPPKPPAADPAVSQPPSSAAKRVLILSQKGDWPACEQALKALERAVVEGTEVKPLANVADNVTGNTPLMYAAMENKGSIIERMLDLGCDIGAKNKERYTTLHLASMYAREDTIKLLLGKKADPTAPGGPKNQSCVHLVCSRPTSQALQILRALMSVAPKNARVNPDSDGNIPLFAAIDAGNLNVCRELLAHDAQAQIKFAKEPLNDTVLHLAGRRKDNDMVKMFIEAGATVDAKNTDGQTILHIACQNGDENMIRTLYLARANATITDNEDRTAMHLAAEKGHTGTVEFLADKFKASVFDRTKDGSTLMHIAALNGHPDTAMVLFKKGVPLLMPNKDGARGIHTAAMKGHVAVINTLLQRGENVDAVTNDNYTALHLAVEAGKSNVVEALLGHGAQVHIKGGKVGETPLHIAARIEESRGEKCTKMLLKSGADTNLAMSDGRTPLHIAAESGNIAVLKLLLENGANPMNVDSSGETALHKSARRCHHSSVETMLAFVKQRTNSAELFVITTNKRGESALHYAAQIKKATLHFPGEDQQIVKLLMENGSDVFMQTSDTKETVFHYCASEGNIDVLKEILANLHSGQIQLAVNKQSQNGWSPLIVAASKGHTEIAMLYLENNGRVDVFDQEGKSALHLAAENGSIEVCEALLTRNAFINSKTKVGWTSLHYAAMKGSTPLVEFLIKKHNATIDSLTMKKQTPLHLAASSGQEPVCALLLDLGASLDATDDFGQKPIHLAAQSNKSEVVKLFLKQRPQLVSATTRDGSTCAHIAASRGSVSVLNELMKFDKSVVISSRNKLTDSTPLHIATEGGHYEVVKMLMEAGASPSDENKVGYTPIHIAAKYGHLELINRFASSNVNLRQLSRKTGLSALHIASYFGEEETTRELLTHVPAGLKSELPASPGHAISADLASEAELTPLHLGAYSGSENVVRALLNSSGVQVDAATVPSKYTALHLASLRGHVGVVGLLLSRSTQLLKVADRTGQSCLHVAASSGHYEMVQVLLGQGSDYNSVDADGWTPLHSAAKAGYLNVVKLLVESGASTTAETANGRIPLWYAAAEGNLGVVTFLIQQPHDSYSLLDDRKFILNLMSCGKKCDNAPTEDFILASPAPVDVAAKISALFRDLSIKEKERAADLLIASHFSEEICNELVSIASSVDTPGIVMQSCDRRSVPFLDILIECQLKQVIANSAVQTYTTELWKGGIQHWSGVKIFLFLGSFFLFPPLWLVFSLPLDNKYNKTPIVKFGCYLTSHLFFMVFQVITTCMPIYPIIPRHSMFPHWNELVCLIWLAGLLLGQLTSPQDRAGLGMIKIVIIFLNLVAIGIHLIASFLDPTYWPLLIYIRNQFSGCSFLFCCVQILDFLSFHYLFGPWAIIISSLMVDLMKFLTILLLFLFGFSMLTVGMNQPYREAAADQGKSVNNLTSLSPMKDFCDRLLSRGSTAEEITVTPLHTFEKLFFSLFGLYLPSDLKMTDLIEDWTLELFKLVYAVYALVTIIVLINLLIAMMSDTYQRIQQESDTEWKFGLAKLIRNMFRTDASPSPINLVTTWTVYIYRASRRTMKQKDRYKRMDQAGKRISDASALKQHIKTGGGKVSPFNDGLSPTFTDAHRPSQAQVLGASTDSLRGRTFLESAIHWGPIVKKYRGLKEAPKGEPPEYGHDAHG